MVRPEWLQKPGCGFPFAKLVALFTLSNGVLIDWAEGNKHDNENKLFRRLWHRLQSGDLLVADRGFCSYAMIASLLQRGVDSLMRIHQARGFSFAQGRPLGPRDRLIQWQKPPQRPQGWPKNLWKALPQTVALRLVEIKVEQPGFRVRSYVLVTTLTDPIAWPVERLARLYFKRWSIELFFRDIKICMGMDILRCKSPQMVRKEIIMHVIAYNCIRGVMQHIAILYDAALDRLSFKGSVDAIRLWADALRVHANSPRKHSEMLGVLYRLIAQDPVPLRPDRAEPRVKKRRPKNYQLMTQPRAQMVVSASRRAK